MASFSCPSPHPVRCSAKREGHDTNKMKMSNININGTSYSAAWPRIKSDSNNVLFSEVSATITEVAPVTENECIIPEKQLRQNIPTKKQFVDSHRQGLIIEGGVGYRQTVVIRSYEVGPDKTTTIESILNLLQETALNHVWMSGLLSDGFGATHGMMRNNLIWVVSRMQVQVDHYPIWGEVVEIDTWVAASGKNGMRRDWTIRSQATGVVFARATSTWVMMNQKTRRLSKIPEEVRAEISPWFIHKQAITEDNPEKIVKLDNRALYVISDLKPKRSDLDMNQHVNNVKYVGWMLEAIPDHVLESQQLCGIIMEYRRECGSLDIVESLCEPDDDGILEEGVVLEHGTHMNLLNGFSLASEIMEGNGLLSSYSKSPQKFTHLLQINGNNENQKKELVRGKTIWRQKVSCIPFPSS